MNDTETIRILNCLIAHLEEKHPKSQLSMGDRKDLMTAILQLEARNASIH